MGNTSRRRTSTARYTHVLLLLCTTYWTHVCLGFLSRWDTPRHCRSLLALLCVCHVYVIIVVYGIVAGRHKFCSQMLCISCFLCCAVPLILGVSAVVGYFVIYDSKRFELVSQNHFCSGCIRIVGVCVCVGILIFSSTLLPFPCALCLTIW